MVGKRRESGKPQVRHARPRRRRTTVNVRLAETHDPRDRVAIAAGYLRSALSLHPDSDVAEIAVTHLIEAADRLFNRKEGSK